MRSMVWPRHLCYLLLCLMFLHASLAYAEETILDFQSDITVHDDSTMTVQEKITVRAEGEKIKRGIYRDFPTKYQDRSGNPYVVGFQVVGVSRDGSPEPYHIAGRANGERVYIGEKDRFLRPGEYTYTLTYRTDHQLGFFQDFDELYWNVTGNGWDFPIQRVSAEIHLPEDAGRRTISSAGYTGPEGAKGKDFIEERLPSGGIVFRTTRPLRAREGLTVAVSWPKGYIAEPPQEPSPAHGKKRPSAAQENLAQGSWYAGAGMVLLVCCYLLFWARVGRDPEAGVIVVRYTPPMDMTPAVMRYIRRMGYDEKGFAAALINMAVKGHISIYEEDDEYRVAKREGGKAPLSEEEKKIFDHLLGSGQEIRLTQSNHASISGAIKALTSFLSKKYEKIYFLTNRGYFIAGLVITALLLFAGGFATAREKQMVPAFVFICVWLTGWSAGVIMLMRQTVRAWRLALTGRNRALKGTGAVFLTLFSLPFLGGEIAGMTMMAKFSSVMIVAFLVAAMAVNYLFFRLLKAPTRAGRAMLDAIEGFRQFLSATEKDRLRTMNPPDRTPEMFEKYLPYALALDVEQQWAEQFSGVLAGAAAAGEYQPSWYHGTSTARMSTAGFADSLGSALAGAVSSASSAPGSSSGSGGGGSSGGGGGGGGGGGW